jgi:hypothetical protein
MMIMIITLPPSPRLRLSMPPVSSEHSSCRQTGRENARRREQLSLSLVRVAGGDGAPMVTTFDEMGERVRQPQLQYRTTQRPRRRGWSDWSGTDRRTMGHTWEAWS